MREPTYPPGESLQEGLLFARSIGSGGVLPEASDTTSAISNRSRIFLYGGTHGKYWSYPAGGSID